MLVCIRCVPTRGGRGARRGEEEEEEEEVVAAVTVAAVDENEARRITVPATTAPTSGKRSSRGPKLCRSDTTTDCLD